MPGEVIGAGLNLVGGILGNRASNKAADAQERSTQKALAYQRERDTKAEKFYEQQYKQSMAGKRALLQRYGLSIPEWDPQTPPPGAVPRGAPQGRPGNLSQLAQMQGGPPQAPQAEIPGRDYSSWDKWARYGLREG